MPDTESTKAQPLQTRTIAWIAILVIAVIAVAAFVGAAFAITQKPAAKKGGTWICQDSTGGQMAVTNPANCGPGDLVLWCTNWVIDNPADNSGHCAD